MYIYSCTQKTDCWLLNCSSFKHTKCNLVIVIDFFELGIIAESISYKIVATDFAVAFWFQLSIIFVQFSNVHLLEFTDLTIYLWSLQNIVFQGFTMLLEAKHP